MSSSAFGRKFNRQWMPHSLSIFFPVFHKGFPLSLALLVLLGIAACTIGPSPLSFKELSETIDKDQKTLTYEQVPVTHPIDLYEAMARALHYNLDYRVRLLEKTVALSELDLSDMALLPKMAANAGFSSRDPVEPSSDRKSKTADLNIVWNVLDFGVSYYQAKQTSDRLLIAEENRRKLVHTQLQEVQSAFWHAVSSQELQGEIRPILDQAFQALEDAYVIEKERLRPQLEIMRYQRALLDIVQQLEALQQELELAKKQLAKLINLPPTLPFELKVPASDSFELIPIQITPEEMEQLALQNRPELRQVVYNTRISALDTRKELLKILPGLEFKGSHNYDATSSNLYSNWETAGLQVTTNLINLVSAPTTIRLGENQEALNHMRRLALNMAIISQVHIAFQKYADSTRKFEISKKINFIDQRVLKNIALSSNLNTQNRLDWIQAATRSIMSRLQHNKAFAETQNAMGLMFVSLGVDLLPTTQPSDTLATLTQSLQKAVEAWNSGISARPKKIIIHPDPLASLVILGLEEALIPDENEFSIPLIISLDDFLSSETLPTEAIVDEMWEREKKETAENNKKQDNPLEFTDNEEETPLLEDLEEALTDENAELSEEMKTEDEDEKEPSSEKTTTLNPEIQPILIEEIQELVKKWTKAWSRHRVGKFLSFYSSTFQPKGNWSKQQWTDAYTHLFNASTTTQITLTDLAIELKTEDQARVFVHLMFHPKDPQQPKEPPKEKQKTLLLSKEKTGWLIVEEISGIQFESPTYELQPEEDTPSQSSSPVQETSKTEQETSKTEQETSKTEQEGV